MLSEIIKKIERNLSNYADMTQFRSYQTEQLIACELSRIADALEEISRKTGATDEA